MLLASNHGIRYIVDIYWERIKDIPIFMLIDALGLASVFEVGSINVTWWYMGAAHFI